MPIQSNNKMQSDANGQAPELIGIEAAAARLSLSPWTLRRWISDRRITSVRIGTRRLIPVSEISRLISAGLEPRDEAPPGSTP
jgi:excisionase family DNA binding protein